MQATTQSVTAALPVTTAQTGSKERKHLQGLKKMDSIIQQLSSS